MTKVVVAPIKLGKSKSLKTKKIRRPDGGMTTVRVVSADSPTLASDLMSVFRANVTAVRRANTALSSHSPKIASAWKAARAAESSVSMPVKESTRGKKR